MYVYNIYTCTVHLHNYTIFHYFLKIYILYTEDEYTNISTTDDEYTNISTTEDAGR